VPATRAGCLYGPLTSASTSRAPCLCRQPAGRRVLHVQSISEWAPSCIGPYSQATRHAGLVLFAGQVRRATVVVGWCGLVHAHDLVMVELLSLFHQERETSQMHTESLLSSWPSVHGLSSWPAAASRSQPAASNPTCIFIPACRLLWTRPPWASCPAASTRSARAACSGGAGRHWEGGKAAG